MPGLDVTLRRELPGDEFAVEALNARAFGPGRYARTMYRLREGRPAEPRTSFVAQVGSLLVGAVRMTAIRCGSGRALLLGPLVVEPAFANKGIGRALIEASVAAAVEAGESLVVLVGDAPYYARAGFAPVPPGRLVPPGPVDPARLLARELVPGALEARAGPMMRASPERVG